MLTARIGMTGGVQGKPLLSPAVSDENQGVAAEGLFAKSMGELISDSAGTTAQLEQAMAGAEKGVFSTKDLTEAGSEISDAGETPVSSSLQRAVATNVPLARAGEGLSGEGTAAFVPVQGEIEKVVASKTSTGADAADGSVVEPQQSAPVLPAPTVGTASQAVATAAVISKEAASVEKLRTAEQPTAETKREIKKKENQLPPAGDLETAMVGVDVSAVQSAIAAATVSPGLTVSVEVPVVPKTESGVASATSALVGSGGARITANMATGIAVNGGKDRARREKETGSSNDAAGVTGVSGAGNAQNAEAKTFTMAGNGEAAAKPQSVGAMDAVSSVASGVAVDGSMGVHGVVRKLSSGVTNEGGSRAGSADAAAGWSQEVSGQNSVSGNDGHRVLLTTPTSLEVGVADGSHGWLKIRAELADGGAVNASVSAASSAGQEMLHRELPSLTAFLHSEQLGVNSVVVHATAATTETRDFTATSSGEQRGQAQPGGGGQSGDSGQDLRATDSDRLDNGVPFAGLEGTDVDALSLAGYGEGGSSGGGWLSVMA